MKFLAVVLAIFVVAQLAVAADNSPVNDLAGAFEEQERVEHNNIKIETEDIPTVTRRCTNVVCNNLCRSRGFRLGICVSATICRCYR